MISTYKITEFLQWYREGSLRLRPDFQRRENWPQRAKIYFVDTILRGYPVPLIYLRARLDPKTKSPIREVVDGQQRLTAIIQFSDGKFPVRRKASRGTRDLDMTSWSFKTRMRFCPTSWASRN